MNNPSDTSKNPAKTVSFAAITTLCAAILLAGCGPKQSTKPQDMAFNELEEKVKTASNETSEDSSTKLLETLVAKYPDHPEVPVYKLKLADSYLQEGKFDSAYELYEHFCRLYPSHKQAEYAQFQAISAKFYQTLKISDECDSSDTEETLRMCELYLGMGAFNAYRKEVTDIQMSCENRQLDKEIHVYNSYVRRGKYQSAEHRLKHLRNHFLPKDPSLNPRILYLECKLARKQNNDELATKNLECLLSEYPESQFTRMAEGLLSRRTIFA